MNTLELCWRIAAARKCVRNIVLIEQRIGVSQELANGQSNRKDLAMSHDCYSSF
jgi:hypothetical protein